MATCVFYTFAYNAEKTVERTMRSVMAQSGDWVYHIVDNGSTDGTGEVIRRVATEDNRIIPCANCKNKVWEPGNAWWDLVRMYQPDDYLCIVDADDTYKPDFLSTMQPFLEQDSLDIAVCGNEFLDAVTKELKGIRSLKEELILEGRGFSYYFPIYHQFMRTDWAKLIRMEVLQQIDHIKMPNVIYGKDTIIATESFQNARRVGILGKALYEYYVSTTSLSYQGGWKRAEPLEPLYTAAESLLESKCGRVTARNRDFLACVYLNDLKDALCIILNAQDPVEKKLDALAEVFQSRPLRLVLAPPAQASGPYVEELSRLKPDVLGMIRTWLMSLDEVPDGRVEYFCLVGIAVCEALGDEKNRAYFLELLTQ